MDVGLIGHPAALQARLEQRPLLQLLFNGGCFVTGLDATVIADVPLSAQRIGVNYLDRDYMIAALKVGKSSISRPVMGKQAKAPIFAMSVPVYDAQGKVIGVLVGVTNLGKPNFLDTLTNSQYGKTGGYLLIHAPSRQIITATDKKRIMEVLPAAGVNRYVDRNIAGYEGYSVLVNPLGDEQLASVKQIPAVGWYVLLGTPTAEAFAPLQHRQQRLLWASALLTLLTAALTWWVLKRQLAPLVATVGAMAALADSKQIPQPLAATQQGEVGQLVAAFNRILQTWTKREAALKDSQQNLAITLNSIGEAVIATDSAGAITSMNPTAERLTDWPLADALGRPLSEVFHIINAQTRLPAPNPVQLVMERGEVVGLANHTALLDRDGREYQISDSAAPIRNPAGEILGVVLVFSDVTEKYRLNEALRNSEVQFRTFAAFAPAGIYVTAANGDCLYANSRWCEMAGMDMKDALGSGWVQGVHPEDRDSVFANWKRMVDSEGTWGMEYRFQTPDKQVTWVYALATPQRDDAGQIEKYFGINLDITARKQVEAALVTSEERWKFAIEGAGDGLWDWNVHTGEAFYSPRYKQMYGYANADFSTTSDEWLKRIHPDDAPGVFAALQPYMEGKPGSATVEFRMLCKDGSWLWTMGRGMVVERDAAGNPLRMIGTNADITERKAHEKQLEHIAHFDALTNLPNRVLLADRLQQVMAQAQRRQQQVAVAYLDLDGFKAINDRHGHEIGDQVLITLAKRMKDALREGDTMSRLGGDEFVAVLIDLEDPSASVPLLDRLLAATAQPVQVGDLTLQVSASLGVTYYPQAHDIDADQLLRQADQAMYQAKLAGKNCFCVFDAVHDSSLRSHFESQERIRLALVQHEFVLHYQPKVNMRTGKVIGAEALIRWQHPEKGLLAPMTFLPVIENHPLAVDVGEWVIDTAMHQMETWHAAGLDLPVSVNIGARQLQQANFMEQLQATLARHPQVHPECIELEVLETSALADMAQVSQVIEDCAKIGVRFALDDFGTGYSSLTYLKRLHVAQLKIDQSFVRDMLDDPDDLAILQGVISLAAAFKREVIAEGVETVAHGTALLQLGCELAQGYCIARPMPPEQMPAWAANWQPDTAWLALREREEGPDATLFI
jgi:diguanylate cyclase (GGDEF)-like protein/PAS domain S-box-containing protein